MVGDPGSISPSISIDNIDTNKDGKNDEIRVKVSLSNVGTKADEQIMSALVVQTVKYQIRDTISADFKFPLINVFESPRGGFQKLRASGSINMT